MVAHGVQVLLMWGDKCFFSDGFVYLVSSDWKRDGDLVGLVHESFEEELNVGVLCGTDLMSTVPPFVENSDLLLVPRCAARAEADLLVLRSLFQSLKDEAMVLCAPRISTMVLCAPRMEVSKILRARSWVCWALAAGSLSCLTRVPVRLVAVVRLMWYFHLLNVAELFLSVLLTVKAKVWFEWR